MIRLYEAKITDFTQADYTTQYSLLECAIREKIDAKQDQNSKLQSLAGYVLLYRALNDLYPGKRAKITFNQHGKPMCDLCYFSISHCQERVVCVVSDKLVGVDIQKIEAISQRKNYKLFNTKECDYVNQIHKFVSQRYIEVFTKKEAAIKMLGLTLSYGADVDTFSDKFYFDATQKDDFFLCICTERND